jgi:hypothetical protein
MMQKATVMLIADGANFPALPLNAEFSTIIMRKKGPTTPRLRPPAMLVKSLFTRRHAEMIWRIRAYPRASATPPAAPPSICARKTGTAAENLPSPAITTQD